MGIFYAAYLGKKFVQRRQGITTNQIGKGAKPRKVLLIENIIGWATFAIIPVEIISIVLYPKMTLLPALKDSCALQWTGLAVTAVGVAFFIVAMLTMADSWRAGIPEYSSSDLCGFSHNNVGLADKAGGRFLQSRFRKRIRRLLQKGQKVHIINTSEL